MLSDDWLCLSMYLSFMVSRQGISMLGTGVYIVYISPRAMRISGLYQISKVQNTYKTKNYEQIHWSKIFGRMYGLAVMLSVTTRGNIDKMVEKYSLNINII